MMPKNATYYFTRATVKRALPSESLAEQAAKYNLKGACYPTVDEALEAAKRDASQMIVGFVPNFCQRPISPVEVVTFENPFLTCSAVMLYPLSLRTFNSDSIVFVFFI